ncbi:hypothetical protein Cfor_01162 [Coptotermes formosanus]|jgi:hypothetical protein|uniref:Reverse transcriptase domain-containing protein n=1 Tax=Coptotermes formosanus TaxID=36987 RepID=A0A6L2Q1Q8_COPFO|nr:hypothetical protein Cfor_01162 [Coptotermes formosanus]
MGAPTSALFSEFFLQYNEHAHIFNLLNIHNIKGYFRYVDGILIIYNKDETDNLVLKDLYPPITNLYLRIRNRQ